MNKKQVSQIITSSFYRPKKKGKSDKETYDGLNEIDEEIEKLTNKFRKQVKRAIKKR